MTLEVAKLAPNPFDTVPTQLTIMVRETEQDVLCVVPVDLRFPSPAWALGGRWDTLALWDGMTWLLPLGAAPGVWALCRRLFPLHGIIDTAPELHSPLDLLARTNGLRAWAHHCGRLDAAGELGSAGVKLLAAARAAAREHGVPSSEVDAATITGLEMGRQNEPIANWAIWLCGR